MTTKTAILQAIRRKCLDCSGQQPVEVRKCLRGGDLCAVAVQGGPASLTPEPGLLEANSEQCPSPGTPVAQDRSSSGIGLQEAISGRRGQASRRCSLRW